MTLQYASDLHLEMPDNSKWLRAKPLIPSADTLILAGDIMPFTELHHFDDFITYLSDHFKTTYWLPGNHEYYGSDILQRSGSLREAIRPNVFLVNNVVEQLEEVRLVFSTLWSHISPLHEWDIARALTDFRIIRYGEERFRPLHTNRLHHEARQFIEQIITTPTSTPTIVVTHHVPTFVNYPAQYQHSPVNEGFATELYDLIDPSNITAWIYGHHHRNVPAFTIGNTQLLTNQLGYVRQREYYGFRRDATINL